MRDVIYSVIIPKDSLFSAVPSLLPPPRQFPGERQSRSVVLSSAPCIVSLLLGSSAIVLVFILFGPLSHTGFPQMLDNPGMSVIFKRETQNAVGICSHGRMCATQGSVAFFTGQPANGGAPGLAAGRGGAGGSAGPIIPSSQSDAWGSLSLRIRSCRGETCSPTGLWVRQGGWLSAAE